MYNIYHCKSDEMEGVPSPQCGICERRKGSKFDIGGEIADGFWGTWANPSHSRVIRAEPARPKQLRAKARKKQRLGPQAEKKAIT